MDNQRLFLFVALSFVVLLIWQAWMEDYGPAPQEVATPAATETAALPDTGADLPVAQIRPVGGGEIWLDRAAADAAGG